jgi:hypothetical protein
MFSWNLYALSAICALVNSIVSTIVGARFYTEEATAAVGQAAFTD